VHVKQAIDLRHATVFDRAFIDPLTFEVQGPQRAWRFVADDAAQHARWVGTLKGAVLGLALEGGAEDGGFGWQHRRVRGSLFSAALEGDVPQLEAIVAYHRRNRRRWCVRAEQEQGQGEEEGEEEEEEEEEEAIAELLSVKDEWGLQPVHYAAAEGQVCGWGRETDREVFRW
jgi:hypothetical protein